MLTKGSATTSIHYLNSNGHLFQIADNLATYIRLMVLYLGLPDWPLVHLKMDLSYWNKVLMPNIHCALRSASNDLSIAWSESLW